MKFENKYIKIKTKEQEITLHNYIYDKYLALFSQSQYETDEETLISMNHQKHLYNCYVKFETNVEDITNATKSDFDISLEQLVVNTIGNSNSVCTSYTYSTRDNKVFDLQKQLYQDIGNYIDKKITALAFGNDDIMSCVDTSNYNVQITKAETFVITRKDIMTTDGVCDGIEYPLHLASASNMYEITEAEALKVPVWAKLYSIGFGRIKGNIDDEYVIGKDIEVIKESDTVFKFNLLKSFQQNIHPQTIRYTGSRLYPLSAYVPKEMHPSVTMYCSNGRYPLKSDYKYIIYKYRLYYYDTMQGKIIKLDKYYTLSYLETKAKGLFEIKTKIERRG